MTFRYIGSKARLIEQIANQIGPPSGDVFFVDAFCGTGVVAEAAAMMGWPVRVNDNLVSAVISAEARLVSKHEALFENLGGYSGAIEKLNRAEPVQGFMWKTYSPASVDFCGIERRYFTEENAAKLDAMRNLVGEWVHAGAICKKEERLLISDLFGAINRSANIAGTFGCFLAKWTSQSQVPLQVCCRELKEEVHTIETCVGDVFDVPNKAGDLVYLDPPYTKRQYASYYHLLETVAVDDEPKVEGVAGLRPWKDRASEFCYKARALNTLVSLVSSLHASRILLSYSSEGHIGMQDMEAELSKIADLDILPLGAIGRYRPNKVASDNAANVTEYLVEIAKPSTSLGVDQNIPILSENRI